MLLGLLDRNSTKQDHDYESLKASNLNWSELFLYYIYCGSVQTIPTYRVHRLYDTVIILIQRMLKKNDFNF